MIAAVAAAGLAMGTLPGVANAQDSAELGLDLGAALGSAGVAVDLGVALGSEMPDPGELEPGTGSLSGLSSEFPGSSDEPTDPDDPDTGSLSGLSSEFPGSSDEPTDPDDPDTGSLEGLFTGSLGSADDDGQNGGGDNDGNGSADIDAEVLLAVGSLAAAGIAAGIAVSGGVDLPPLPDVNVGLVCELPQEGIDFLKGNGSMEQDECEPEEQN